MVANSNPAAERDGAVRFGEKGEKMKNIYKYPLEFAVSQVINAPIIKVLDVQVQGNIPTLWAIVGDENEKEVIKNQFTVFCFGTGTKDVDKYMSTSLQENYISTTQIGRYVFHWFIA